MPLQEPVSFAQFMARHIEGKVQKISVNAALSCPNRDGTKGRGGCAYCNNASFSPDYALKLPSVSSQLLEGKRFFARKYPSMRYLAYFQSYTSTNAPLHRLIDMYEEALAIDDVAGLIIGTRPDCMPDELLQYLAGVRRRGRFAMVEYGAESACDATLELLNRCHGWAETSDAVMRTKAAGMPVGLHLIMGLPGEDTATMMRTIDSVNQLPVDIIKCHQLQLIKGTRLAADAAAGKCSVKHYTVDEYLELCCRIIARLRSDIAVERFVSQSPDELLISPRWGLKNYQFMNLLRNKLHTYNIQAPVSTPPQR